MTAGATIAAERGTISLAAHAPVATGSDGSATVNAETALIVLAAHAPTVGGGGVATPGATFSLPFNPLDVPAADLDAIDDELAALLTTLVLA